MIYHNILHTYEFRDCSYGKKNSADRLGPLFRLDGLGVGGLGTGIEDLGRKMWI